MANGNSEPLWENKYPGRMQYELGALVDCGAQLAVDECALSKGRLVIELNWPLDGGVVALKATFPDSYPTMRPAVQLIRRVGEYPLRHCSPLDGTLCLLGRDTAQWKPSFTLADLLRDRLKDALEGTGEEDEQGEPDEFWWQMISLPHSFIITDSSWSPSVGSRGIATVRYNFKKGGQEPIFRGVLESARLESSGEVVQFDLPSPPDVANSDRTVEIQFVVSANRFIAPSENHGQRITELIEDTGVLENANFVRLSPTFKARLAAVIYPTEVGWKSEGQAWLFYISWGSNAAQKSGNGLKARPIKAFRAGAGDIGARVSAFNRYSECKAALFGAGALGSTLACELARNGIAELRVLDKDKIEPGNSVRWLLGAEYWGKSKPQALAQFLKDQYPKTKVVPFDHAIGNFSGEEESDGDVGIFEIMVEGVDVVIDASASTGVSNFIADQCRDEKLPLISCYGTLGLLGGAVIYYDPTGACPNCLEHHFFCGNLDRPPSDEEGYIQPPGCSERTFSGSSYDLSEISMQAMRAIQTVLASTPSKSFVLMMSFVDADGIRIPEWTHHAFDPHEDCPLHG